MEIPRLTVSPESLYNLQYGSLRSHVLMTAVEFGVFDLTVSGKTASEVAEAINTHGSNTELLLNALCSIGLMKKNGGSYINSELAETFLVNGRDTYLGNSLLMNENWLIQSCTQMKDLIKNGPSPARQESDYTGDYWARNLKAMRNFARSGLSQRMAEEVSSLPGFARMKKMIDLGGGHGMDCTAIVMRHPSLKGIVFDKPEVVAVTEELVSEYDDEGRITVMGGDYSTDLIGERYDLVYAKATLNFLKDNLKPLFKKIYDALNPGGYFVSAHDGLTHEGTKPEGGVISWLSTSLSYFDMSFDQDAIPNAMLKAGFQTVRSKPIPFPMGGVLDITIARKL